MGSIGAAGMAEAVDDGLASLTQALIWHLQSNHYPPHPAFMVPVCLEAIEAAQDEEWDRSIDLPDRDGFQVTWQDGRTSIKVWEAIEEFHLDSYFSVWED